MCNLLFLCRRNRLADKIWFTSWNIFLTSRGAAKISHFRTFVAHCYCIFETILFYFCTLTDFTHNPRSRLSHQFSLCITPHRGGASTLIKAASGLLYFLADVCAYFRSRPRWLYAVIKNCASRVWAIICTRCVIDRSRFEVTPGVFDDDWATVDIWGKMGYINVGCVSGGERGEEKSQTFRSHHCVMASTYHLYKKIDSIFIHVNMGGLTIRSILTRLYVQKYKSDRKAKTDLVVDKLNQ